MSEIEVTDKTVATELSKSWAEISMGKVPGEVDVFFILWQDRVTDKFLSWGTYLSTSEPSPHIGADAFVVLQTKARVSPRTPEAFQESVARAIVDLENEFFRTPKYTRLCVKLKNDLTKKAPAAIEVVSEHDFEVATGLKVRH